MSRSADTRYSIVAFNMSLLTVKFQIGLPYRNVWIKLSLPWDKIWSLILLILFKTAFAGLWKLGQWRKKSVIVSVSLPQSLNGSGVSWRQCLNLWSQKLLRPRWNLFKRLILYGLWILKILFAQGHIKCKRFFLKIERRPEFLIFQSIFFHLDIAAGKNYFLK